MTRSQPMVQAPPLTRTIRHCRTWGVLNAGIRSPLRPRRGDWWHWIARQAASSGVRSSNCPIGSNPEMKFPPAFWAITCCWWAARARWSFPGKSARGFLPCLDEARRSASGWLACGIDEPRTSVSGSLPSSEATVGSRPRLVLQVALTSDAAWRLGWRITSQWRYNRSRGRLSRTRGNTSRPFGLDSGLTSPWLIWFSLPCSSTQMNRTGVA